MKKAISTILALMMLATQLAGTVCFADEPADNVGDYVQSQDRSERFKFDKKTVVKAGKIASCIAAGTAAVVGATVAGLKIFEDALPESIKELMSKWLRTPTKVDETVGLDASYEELTGSIFGASLTMLGLSAMGILSVAAGHKMGKF